MSIVVSDASPIRVLVHLQLTSLLHSLYGEVLIPPGVADELSHPLSGLLPLDLGNIPGLRIQSPGDAKQVNQLLQTLDRGESEAISLAVEIGATVLLVDERAARLVASSMGINVLGVLAVLVKAKKLQHIPAVQPLLAELRQGLNFYISPKLYQQILKSAGE